MEPYAKSQAGIAATPKLRFPRRAESGGAVVSGDDIRWTETDKRIRNPIKNILSILLYHCNSMFVKLYFAVFTSQ